MKAINVTDIDNDTLDEICEVIEEHGEDGVGVVMIGTGADHGVAETRAAEFNKRLHDRLNERSAPKIDTSKTPDGYTRMSDLSKDQQRKLVAKAVAGNLAASLTDGNLPAEVKAIMDGVLIDNDLL